MTDTKLISGSEFTALLKEIRDNGRSHTIGVERKRAESVVEAGMIKDGTTVTFYDDADQNDDGQTAYCLAKCQRHQLIITHKTYDALDMSQGMD